MMTIDKFNFAGKKAIVRVDFNVPLNEEGKITGKKSWQTAVHLSSCHTWVNPKVK